jgi:hypothetical protein
MQSAVTFPAHDVNAQIRLSSLLTVNSQTTAALTTAIFLAALGSSSADFISRLSTGESLEAIFSSVSTLESILTTRIAIATDAIVSTETSSDLSTQISLSGGFLSNVQFPTPLLQKNGVELIEASVILNATVLAEINTDIKLVSTSSGEVIIVADLREDRRRAARMFLIL